MKTLNDIKADMSRLYDELQAGTCELKTASELANRLRKLRLYSNEKRTDALQVHQAHVKYAPGAGSRRARELHTSIDR